MQEKVRLFDNCGGLQDHAILCFSAVELTGMIQMLDVTLLNES